MRLPVVLIFACRPFDPANQALGHQASEGLHRTGPWQRLALSHLLAYLGMAQGKVFAMQSLFQILMLLLGVAKFFIFAHVIMSWLINFQVLNTRQQFVAQIWYSLNRLLEPVYGPVRRILPPMGGIDLAPLVVLLGVFVLEIILRNNAAFFF
jgi:YggT family protein